MLVAVVQRKRESMGGSAVRVDKRAGVSDDVSFAEVGGAGVFCCSHTPLGDLIGGVVICSSLHAEHVDGYRQEVILARSLAARGYAAQRFHYRGSGHSDGDSSAATLGTMRDDALAARDLLAGRVPSSQIAFLGARWGALVAAGAAARSGAAPLVLCEPAIDPERYFREAIRARLIHELKAGVAQRPSSELLLDELRRNGRIDVLGYPLDLELYDSAAGRDLVGELGDRPRPVLIVDYSRSRAMRTPFEQLAARLREMSCEVTTRAVPEPSASWFSRRVLRTIDALGELTSDWLAGVAAPEAAR